MKAILTPSQPDVFCPVCWFSRLTLAEGYATGVVELPEKGLEDPCSVSGGRTAQWFADVCHCRTVSTCRQFQSIYDDAS